MPLPLTGSAAVTNGLDTLTWTGAALTPLNCVAGATIALNGLSYFVAERLTTSSLKLTRNYAGTTASVPAEIVQLSPEQVATATLNKRAADVMSQLATTDANGRGLWFNLIGVTGDNDPGPGNLAFNHATVGSITEIYIDVLDLNGPSRNVSAIIGSWRTGTDLILRSLDSMAYIAFRLEVPPSGSGGYRKLVGTVTAAPDGALPNGPLAIEWHIRGESFAIDDVAADIAGLSAYSAEADGFRVMVADLVALGSAFDLVSGVVEKSGGSWPVVAIYTGPQGIRGNNGWSPRLMFEADGARLIMKLAGYVGGEGTAPTTNVGQYLKDDGTFTSTKAEAVDFRGATGATGSLAGVTSFWQSIITADTDGSDARDELDVYDKSVIDALAAGVIRHDEAQSLSAGEKAQAAANIGVLFTEAFASADQTITSAGSLTLPHGLSKVPALLQSWIKCVTAEHGYAVGDTFPLHYAGDADGSAGALSALVIPDATNLAVRYGTGALWGHHKTTGARVSLTLASWRFIFKAFA